MSLLAQPARQWSRRWLRYVVTTSLPGLCLASGCFFAPLPLPGDPEPERPNVNVNGIVPPVFQVLNVISYEETADVSFTVPFTSVDAGQDVYWFLWKNWNLVGMSAKAENKGFLPWRPPDLNAGMGGATATERSIIFFWGPDNTVQPGCNQLTLFITHAENANFITDLPRDFSQAAIVTFWVNVQASFDQAPTDCPPPAVGPLTAP